jgi:hypothetical protein
MFVITHRYAIAEPYAIAGRNYYNKLQLQADEKGRSIFVPSGR